MQALCQEENLNSGWSPTMVNTIFMEEVELAIESTMEEDNGKVKAFSKKTAMGFCAMLIIVVLFAVR
ncbi:unnamed protein product [Cylicostephanus goldi]|uniref:Uncharacterized protein n=1 Tax=Cylicostephanus goldi TaxID=71465 RepID=A0A3P6S9G3_CYLGO|nr:unnamed protein product [Cylicostephanus goldi]